jgi:HlyD family secretion protein
MRPSHFLLILGAVMSCGRSSGENLATGTIEIVEVDVAPTIPGRVSRVLVDEGQSVRAGDTLAVLVQPTSRADIQYRAAQVAAAQAGLSEMQHGARAAEIRKAESELNAAAAEAARAERDYERLKLLLVTSAVSEQQVDAAHTAARSAADHRDAVQESLRLLREGTRPERIASGRASVETARAALSAAEASQKDLILLAPIDGVILSRNAEPGETLLGGQPAITLGDTRKLWVRVYVNEAALPKIRIGDSVSGFLDSDGAKSFRGKVVAINTRAEFTPRVALTEEERADLMFGVKIELQDSTGVLKPGLPITIRFAAGPSGRK